jgi:hypothetical protein
MGALSMRRLAHQADDLYTLLDALLTLIDALS